MEMSSKQRDFVRQAFEIPEAPLDAVDRRIVAELQAAPRLRVAELSRRIGLSGPAVADRLRRLEDSGTLSYRAEVDPRALGYSICAIVRISPAGGGLRLIPGIAREVPNVTECYRITGEDCYFIKLYLCSIDDLEPILDLFTPHGRTTTSIVHSAPVPLRPLPVPGSVPTRSLADPRVLPGAARRARPVPAAHRDPLAGLPDDLTLPLREAAGSAA
jgi:Lrp/AsnC family transcriptional regulator, leucine-responsive regulatory protein